MQMSRGPVELLVVAFPEAPANAHITSELRAVVDAGTVRVLDGVVIRKDEADEEFAAAKSSLLS
jgi:hypothetical protein